MPHFIMKEFAFFVQSKGKQTSNNFERDMTSTREIDQKHVIRIKNSKHTLGDGGSRNNDIFVTHISLVSKPNCTYDAIGTSKMSTSEGEVREGKPAPK